MGSHGSRDAEKHIKKLGKALNRLDSEAIKTIDRTYKLQKYSRVPYIVVAYANKAYEIAQKNAIAEIEEARKAVRSYGLRDSLLKKLTPNEFSISEYYYYYLLELAGNIHEESIKAANMALAKAEEAGKGVNETVPSLAEVLKKFAIQRLKTIIRTEGTRVASAARRDIALKAAEGGMGPHWLIYTSIMDDRTTQTCQIAHNHKRPVDRNSHLWLEIPPPAHYNCRSLERYGFRWFPNDVAVPDWDTETLMRFRQMRQQEFPKWVPRQLPSKEDEPLFKIS